MKISASIVTYNSIEEIETALYSLLNSKNVKIDITVVDNASVDGTPEKVASFSPLVRLIKSEKNLGFGAGHNLAINGITSKYHIFVNPDITVEQNQISKMISFMEENPDVVILTPKVLNPDGSEQFLPKKRPRIKYVLSGSLETKGKVFKKWREEYTLQNKEISNPIEIDFCTGCFMLCRSDSNSVFVL